MKSYINVFRNYANFSGFLGRKPYWIAMLIHVIIQSLLAGLITYASVNLLDDKRIVISTVIFSMYQLLSFIPFWAATVRRLHSVGKSGWWALFNLLPLIGWGVLLVFLFQKGSYEAARDKLDEIVPGFSEIADRPRNGKWFFPALILTLGMGIFALKSLSDVFDINLNDDYKPVATIETVAMEEQNKFSELQPDAEEAAMAEAQFADTDNLTDGSDEVAAAAPTQEPTEIAYAPMLVGVRDAMALLNVDDQFYIDKYPVTNKQYAACVAEGLCTAPAEPPRQKYYKNREKKLHPVTNVSQTDARAYCEWAGRRLPSKDEWELAAFGTENASTYPWGDSFDPAVLNYAQSGLKGTAAVGDFSEGISPFGVQQMYGNVWEWTDSPSTEENELSAFLLGGGWNTYETSYDGEVVLEASLNYRANNTGFRCLIGTDEIDPEAVREPSEVELEDTVGLLVNMGGEANEEIREADGALRVFISSDSFQMGTNSGSPDEKPQHQVSLSGYWIDLTEISNAQYAMCVEDGACTAPQQTKSFKRADYFSVEEYAEYPVVMVDWNQANAYCTWAGARLPTEAEWEYAAKGPDGLLYPWGNSYDVTKLNCSSSGINDTSSLSDFTDDISGFGVMGMGGNVSEWVADRYQENWYSVTDQPVDPTGPTNGIFRVIRGASWQTGTDNARTVSRFTRKESIAGFEVGFRCASND